MISQILAWEIIFLIHAESFILLKYFIDSILYILNSDSTSINAIESVCDIISKNISLTVLDILNSNITPINGTDFFL